MRRELDELGRVRLGASPRGGDAEGGAGGVELERGDVVGDDLVTEVVAVVSIDLLRGKQ
jgi:hypothetical protein